MLWGNPGTRSTSFAITARRRLAPVPSLKGMAWPTVPRTITSCSLHVVPTVLLPSWMWVIPQPCQLSCSIWLLIKSTDHVLQLWSLLISLHVSHFQKVLTAMNQTWHPEHFFCSHCGEVFGAEGRWEATTPGWEMGRPAALFLGTAVCLVLFSALPLRSQFHA